MAILLLSPLIAGILILAITNWHIIIAFFIAAYFASLLFSFINTCRMAAKIEKQLNTENIFTIKEALQEWLNFNQRSPIQEKTLRILADITTKEHLTILKIKKARSYEPDDYGQIRNSGWKRECQYYTTEVLIPKITNSEVFSKLSWLFSENSPLLLSPRDPETLDYWFKYLDERIDINTSTENENTIKTLPKNGHDFEKFVASIVERSGWTATITKGSGDHGVDVIAQRASVRIAIQCKLYSQNVGNSAVQQVYSAKDFYGCDHACVVSNAGFTRAAKTAAYRLKVFLLHHEELQEFLETLIY